MTLLWFGGFAGNTNYAVYYKKIKNTDWNLYKNTNETEIIISNLEKNAVYDFKVVASNGKLTAESAVVYNVNLGKEYIFGLTAQLMNWLVMIWLKA